MDRVVFQGLSQAHRNLIINRDILDGVSQTFKLLGAVVHLAQID